MNYKKGFFRVWLVSLPLVFGWTYFSAVGSSTSVKMHWYEYHQAAKREMSKPICKEIIIQNPTEFPSMSSPHPCANLSIFWKELREDKKDRLIEEKDIDAIFQKNWSNYPVKQGLIAASFALFGYHIFLGLLALLFYITRWVVLGFRK